MSVIVAFSTMFVTTVTHQYKTDSCALSVCVIFTSLVALLKQIHPQGILTCTPLQVQEKPLICFSVGNNLSMVTNEKWQLFVLLFCVGLIHKLFTEFVPDFFFNFLRFEMCLCHQQFSVINSDNCYTVYMPFRSCRCDDHFTPALVCFFNSC